MSADFNITLTGFFEHEANGDALVQVMTHFAEHAKLPDATVVRCRDADAKFPAVYFCVHDSGLLLSVERIKFQELH